MAELKIAPARETSNAPAVIIAILILSGIAAAIFYFNPHRVSEFKVTSVETYAPRTTFGALEGPAANGMHVLGTATTSTEDDLYIIATLNLTDKLRLPLFISGATAHATLEDGSQVEANLLSGADLKRLEVIFPEIQKHAIAPISDGDEIEPGQTRVGTLVLPFPGKTADDWHKKKAATVTIQLRNQDPQTIALP